MKLDSTPGPWNILPLSGKYYATKVELSDGTVIKVWGKREWKPSIRELALWDNDDISDMMSDGHYEDIKHLANARLIAAAPEMLEDLIAWAKTYEDTAQEYRTIKLIEKATGKTWEELNA